jgi:hypothetical protein
LQDRTSFVPETAKPVVREFNDAVSSAISVSDVSVPQREQCNSVLTVFVQSLLRGRLHLLRSHNTKVSARRTRERIISSPSTWPRVPVNMTTYMCCLACMDVKQLHFVENV